jgi:fission 1 protein/division protein 1
MFGHDGDDSDSLPDLGHAPPHLNPHHNPWQTDDPEEGDISNFRFTETGPGRYNLQATVTRSVSPQGGIAVPGSIGGFMAMLNGLTGAAMRPQGQPQSHGEGLFSGAEPGSGPNQSAFQESQNQGADGGPRIRGGTFMYHGGARLFPGNGNNPGRAEPVDEITK